MFFEFYKLDSIIEDQLNCQVEQVNGELGPDDLMTVTFAIPASVVGQVTPATFKAIYLRPILESLADYLNTLGKVKVEMPLESMEEGIKQKFFTGIIPIRIRAKHVTEGDLAGIHYTVDTLVRAWEGVHNVL